MSSKIYLDCTHTYNSGLSTGIQRVVKNIAKHTPEVSKELHIEITPVISISDKYYTFDSFPEINQNKNRLKTSLKKTYVKTRAFLDFVLPKAFGKILYHPNIAIFINKLTDKILFSKKVDRSRLATLKANDILILIDSTWLNNNYKQLESLKHDNIKIVALVYDIIPFSHPEFCTVDLNISLLDWYQKATKYIDRYIAISATVKEDVYSFIKNNINQKIEKEKFDYFYLGADFTTEYDETKIPDTFKSYFKTSNTYLTVSTIEPRKNHSYILDTFDALWENGEDATYVMIGRIGLNTETLVNRIKSHKEYNKKLFLLEDVDDNGLVYAYKNAKALLFASYVEGFGLPLIESLFYKLPVIASNTPIHREIGEENILYFELPDPNSLYNIIKTRQIKSVDSFEWQNWYESTKSLILKAKR